MVGIMVIGPTMIPAASTGAVAVAVMSSEEGGGGGLKKIRKPYTITKSRESWTEQEHDKFLEALQLFDRDWKKIEAFVGSKSVIQIRSHAQKYFLKVQKNGSGEHVPPPRPKRKLAQPYSQKASKLGILASVQNSTPGLPSSTMPAESGISEGSQSGAAFTPQDTFPQPTSSWIHHAVPSGTVTSGLIGAPDFAEIYKFIGSTFDPGVSGHLKKLKKMAPIDRKTIMLLMRNLSINLSSSDFEENKADSSVYDMNVGGQKPAVTTTVDGQVMLT